MKTKLRKFFNCKIFGLHNWTCKASEEIDYSGESLYEYAKMYCKDCGKVSKLSNRLK